MASIALYANKINQMPELIKDVKRAVTDYQSDLSVLKNKPLTINKSVCDLDDVISSIQTSTQTQEDKIASLETFSQNSENFISDVVRVDNNVADAIKKRQDNFYDQYNYLKPEYEKSGWEKFTDGYKAVGEWCKDNWKEALKIIATVIVVIALVVVSIVLICTGVGGIIAAMAWGALIGVAIGGTAGGVVAYNSAKSSGLTGADLFWATVKGTAQGAAIGGVAGILIGATGGVVAAYGAGSVAGTAMITGTATIAARAAEVTALQWKKSTNEGENGWQIANNCFTSVFDNGGKIVGATPLTKAGGTGAFWLLNDLTQPQYKVVPLRFNTFLGSVGGKFGYLFAAYAWADTGISIFDSDPVARAAQRGYTLQ